MPFERYDQRGSRGPRSREPSADEYVVWGSAVSSGHPAMPQATRPATAYSNIIPGPPSPAYGSHDSFMSPPSRPFSGTPKRSSSFGLPPASQYYPPASPDLPPSPRNESSPMLPAGQRTSGYFERSVSDLSHHNGSMYMLEGASTEKLRPAGGWNEKTGYVAQMPKLSHGRIQQRRRSNKRKWLVVGIIILLLAIAAAVVAVILVRNHNSSSNSSGSAANNAAGSNGATSTSSSSAAMPSQSAAPVVAMWGTLGSTVTRDDGSTFVYNNPMGGSWCNVPFNDSARAQGDVPALNQKWDFSVNGINGVNLGGWLVPEPFIVPALFEPYENAAVPAVDEYTLSTNLGANLATTLTNHYETFITEDDIYQIAAAGLNWVRIPIAFWAIETIAGEPFLEGVSWTYFLRAIKWCRKYGIRINMDLHAVPGSQNGWNHSGKLGSVGFMHGPMGVANAQRTMNYIRTITEFISQPAYSNVIAMFSFINEPLLATITRPYLETFYYNMYNNIRNITGIGQGPFLSFHDGFDAVDLWYGFMQGADRLGLDSHPYLAFGNGVANTMQQNINIPCTQWAPLYNTTMNQFGFAMAGEFSLGVNDCGEYVNGVNQGNRLEGTYPGSTYIGSCTPFTDYTTWTPAFKQQLMQFGMGQMDVMRNWFFWTWKIGNSTKTNQVPNPMWSYQLGIQQGYMPVNARQASGSCQSILAANNGGPEPLVAFTALQPWMTGGAGAGVLTPAANAAFVRFPPAGLNGPAYTPTGANPITLPTPTYAGGSTAGNGWANTADAGRWYVPTASPGNYLSPYATVAGRGQVKRTNEPVVLGAGKRNIVYAAPTPAPA